jgi:hypothetical protein
LFLGTTWVLNNRATGFYKSFGYKKPDGYLGTFLKGYKVFLMMVLLFFAYICFYSGYILQSYQPQVTPLLYILGISSVLMIFLSPIIDSAIEKRRRKDKKLKDEARKGLPT